MQRARGPARMAIGAGRAARAIGVGLMCVGLFGSLKSDSAAISFMGGGAALTFLGVALLSPRLVRPLALVIGRPIERATGITGRLARENSVRQPGRTAVTAAALMIGVALVTFASIFAAGREGDDQRRHRQEPQERLRRAEHRRLLAVLARGAAQRRPRRRRLERQRRALLRGQGPRRERQPVGLRRSTRAPSPTLYKLDMKEGGEAAVRSLGAGRRARSRRATRTRTTSRSATRCSVTTPNGKRIAPTVIGIVDDKGGLLADLTVDQRGRADAVRRAQGRLRPRRAPIRAPTCRRSSSRSRSCSTHRYPEAEVLTNQEFKDDIAGQVNQLLGLIYALLALAIIVSLFGIVNTLVLSITRAHARAGHAARDRHVAQAGQAHDPLGGGHHALIGGVLGRVHGRRPRGALHAAARRLHALDPGARR